MKCIIHNKEKTPPKPSHIMAALQKLEDIIDHFEPMDKDSICSDQQMIDFNQDNNNDNNHYNNNKDNGQIYNDEITNFEQQESKQNKLDIDELPQRKKKERRRDRKKDKNQNDKPKIVRPVKEIKYEYLDHTADIQLHSWGKTINEAFEQIGISMFGYMTELETVQYIKSFEINASGHDLNSLLFHFLDECLVTFSCEEYLLFRDIEITEFDEKNFKIKAIGYGECMDLNKHPQGTEVKAITYSAMQIKQTDDRTDCWVVVDI